MNTKLSHSSVTHFQTCAQSWKYHYVDKLRTKIMSSALCFGSSIDKALEALMIGKEDPYVVFFNTWSKQYVNKVLTDLPENPNIVYADSDVDLDLLDTKQQLFLEDKLGALWETDYKDIFIKKDKVGFKNLTDQERSFINLVAWHCLKTKGDLMITAFKNKVYPKIKRVLALQKAIDLTNSDGDKVTGFADMVCEWENGDIVVVDFKTSTRNYDEEAVLTSPQLSLYLHCLREEYNITKAGYIVLNKRITKNKIKICSKCGWNGTGNRCRTCPEEINYVRCAGEWLEKINPEVYIQVLIDTIPEQTVKIVMENIDLINESVKTGVFIRNFSSCKRPWGPCLYYNKCYNNDDSELIQG